MKMLLRLAGGFLRITVAVLIGLVIAEGLFRLVKLKPVPVFDRPHYLVGPPRISPVRERLPLPPKRDDTFRVLVLGDSFTWGANVQMDYTYSKHLQWLLNRSGHRRYEVYNLGVNGATTRDEIKLLQTLTDTKPDLVILGYFLNDPDPNLDLPPSMKPLFEGIRQPSGFVRKLQSVSRLFRFLRWKAWARRLTNEQIAYFHNIFNPDGPLWKRQVYDFKQFAHWLQQQPFDLDIVLWPHLGFPMNRHYPFTAIHARLGRLFQRDGFPYLDLLQTFWGHDSIRLQAVPAYDPHPSEIAHRMAAEAIFDWLRLRYPPIRNDIDPDRILPNPPVPSVRLRLSPYDEWKVENP